MRSRTLSGNVLPQTEANARQALVEDINRQYALLSDTYQAANDTNAIPLN